MTAKTCRMKISGTPSWKRSLIELTKIRRGRFHDNGSSSFSGTSRRSNPCS